MRISEVDRRELYTSLESTIGEKSAEVLMSVLPLSEEDQFATRSDIRGVETGLGAEIARVEAELKAEIAVIRSGQNWIVGLLIAVLAAVLVTGLA